MTKRKKSGKVRDIIWFGTSNSKYLDSKEIERGTNTKIRMIRTNSIQSKKKEDTYDCLKNRVSDVVGSNTPDMIIIQAGDTEITDLNTFDSRHNKSESLEAQRHKWTTGVEKDSENIIKIAEDAVKQVDGLQVVILKRPPRFDKTSRDPLKVKRDLSVYANQALDQLLINLGCETSEHLKQLIFGDTLSKIYNGVSFRGEGATRHFSYRASQAIKPLLTSNQESSNVSSSSNLAPNHHLRSNNYIFPKRPVKMQNIKNQKNGESHRYEPLIYSVPVSNRYQGNF